MDRSVQQPVPVPGGVWVLAQDGGRFGGSVRVGDPAQDMVEPVPYERGSVEVALQHLGGLRDIEPGRGVARATTGGRPDRSCGERLGSALSSDRVDAARDGVPDELR